MNTAEAQAVVTLLASIDQAALDPAAVAAADQLAAAAQSTLRRNQIHGRSRNVQAVVALLPSTECVPWPGKLDPQGYGRIASRKIRDRRAVLAQRRGDAQEGTR